MNKCKSFPIELSCLILLISSFTFIFASGKLPADDGFFYLEIAKNFTEGKGLHFNSLYQTNGFHPLWEIVCILLAYINPFGGKYYIFLVWIIQLILFFQGLRYLKLYWNNKTLILFPITILVIIFCCLGTIYLSEAFLNFFFIALFLNKIDKLESKPFVTGILLSLIFLSRLDNIFIIGCFGIYVCFIQRNFSLINFLKISIGFSILVLPYFIYNTIEFGSIMPVSGKIKSYFPYFEMGGFNNHAKIFLSISVLYFVGLLTVFKNRKQQLIILFFTIGAIIQLVYNGIFQSQIGQWYFVAQFILLGFLIYDTFYLFLGNLNFNSRTHFIILVGCLLICLLTSYVKLTSGFTLLHLKNKQSSKIELKSDIENFVNELNQILPKNARIYSYDIPGKISYYSDFDVIAADGLINNTKFSEDLNKGTFEDFLINHNIDYVIIPSDSHLEFPFTKFLAINTEIKNGVQRVEIKDPYQKKVIYQMNMSRYKEILVRKNPLFTWQPNYDQVKVLQFIK